MKSFSSPWGVECEHVAAVWAELDVPVSIFHVEDGVDLLSVQVPLYIGQGQNVVSFPFYGFV